VRKGANRKKRSAHLVMQESPQGGDGPREGDDVSPPPQMKELRQLNKNLTKRPLHKQEWEKKGIEKDRGWDQPEPGLPAATISKVQKVGKKSAAGQESRRRVAALKDGPGKPERWLSRAKGGKKDAALNEKTQKGKGKADKREQGEKRGKGTGNAGGTKSWVNGWVEWH